LSEGALEKAAVELKMALKLDGQEACVWQRLGELYYLEGKWREAARAFESAADLAPREAAIHAELGRTYPHLERCSQAIEELHLAEQYQTGTEGTTKFSWRVPER
jgi:uncharacterized protein HemY